MATRWVYEGIAGYVMLKAASQHVPLYRAWNGKDHFYTTSKREYDKLPAKYRREGVACYVGRSQTAKHAPLYRFYNKSIDDHFYTISEGEKAKLSRSTKWKLEGIQCYIRATAGDNHVPLYRAWHSRIGDHFYTTNWQEMEAAISPWSTKNTSFDPKRNGFKFENTFTLRWKDLGLPLSGNFGQGLCGGMSLKAKRMFHANQAPPSTTTAPPNGSPLFRDLLACQKKTVLPLKWRRFVYWQARPTKPQRVAAHTIGYATKQEWPKLRKLLNAGKPTVLGLIRVQSSNPADAGKNHQVLAIGYRFNQDTKDLQIDAYDPNHPRKTVQLRFNFGLKNNQINASQSTGEKLRGFFVNEVK